MQWDYIVSSMVCSGTTLLARLFPLLYRLHRGVTDSINDLLSVLSSAAPGQKECEDALRKITVSHMYHICTSCCMQREGTTTVEWSYTAMQCCGRWWNCTRTCIHRYRWIHYNILGKCFQPFICTYIVGRILKYTFK